MYIDINYEKCLGYGCQECLDICPMLVFEAKETVYVKDIENCCRCEVCMDICPTSSITITY